MAKARRLPCEDGTSRPHHANVDPGPPSRKPAFRRPRHVRPDHARQPLMDIGQPLIEYRALDISALRDSMPAPADGFWVRDRDTRTALATDRPGNAVYFYNDNPSFAPRSPLDEVAATGTVSVLRNTSYPLFDIVDALIARHVAPLYPHCDVVQAQLAELPAGAKIRRHRDTDILASLHRLHVPITTNDDVLFTIDGQRFSLAPGVLYELNNVVEHSVHNGGRTMRVHLLVDMMPHALGRALYFDSGKEMLMSMLRTGAYRPRRRGAQA